MEILWKSMEYDGNPMEPYGRLHYEILWHTTTMEYYEILYLYLKCFLTLKLQTRLNTIDNIVRGDAQ